MMERQWMKSLKLMSSKVSGTRFSFAVYITLCMYEWFNLLVSASRIIDATTSLREGDIAVSAGRHSKVCFARSCLWSKSVDGHVYIAYRLSPEYCMLFQSLGCKQMYYTLILFEIRQLCVQGFLHCLSTLFLQTAEKETRLIKKGMENIEKGTCVRFVPWTHQRDYIDIQPKSGWENILQKEQKWNG